MTFSDFVESVTETPIYCELKQHLDKCYELYAKDPEKWMFNFRPIQRGSAKSDLSILLPLFLAMYVESEVEE